MVVDHPSIDFVMTKFLTKFFDTYTILAQFFPAIITALPFFHLWFVLSKYGSINELQEFLLEINVYGKIGISLVFLFFYAQLIRITSKYYENKYFIKNKGFPTTYFMMYSDSTFSENYKDSYREKVTSLVGLNLLDKVQEPRNTEEARKRISEATKQIILKIGDGELVKKHNIWDPRAHLNKNRRF